MGTGVGERAGVVVPVLAGRGLALPPVPGRDRELAMSFVRSVSAREGRLRVSEGEWFPPAEVQQPADLVSERFSPCGKIAVSRNCSGLLIVRVAIRMMLQ